MKPSYKQADIAFHVYILRHILNGLVGTGCMQSKITVSLNLQFCLGLFYSFYFSKGDSMLN